MSALQNGVPSCGYKLEDTPFHIRNEVEMKRTVILDVANIMHTAANEDPFVQFENYQQNKDMNSSDRMTSLTSLLAVMRFFLKNDFETIGITTPKYKNSSITHRDLMQRLIENDLVTVADHHNYDDSLLLETALCIDGVIISQDNYRDHIAADDRYFTIATSQKVNPIFTPIASDLRHRMTTNKHYLAYHRYKFTSSRNDLHDVFFVQPDNPKYEIVAEQREYFTADICKKHMDVIDGCLSDVRVKEWELQRTIARNEGPTGLPNIIF